jgi:N6-adenosine-specific RNA methylase IME4
LAVKGKPSRVSNNVSQLIFAPVGRHSKKPDETRNRVIQLMGGDHPRIELFARETAEGWDTWGNEISIDPWEVSK